VVYSIDQVTGLVTPLPPPFPISSETSVAAVDATGRLVYLLGKELSGLTVSDSGTLQLIPGTPVKLPSVDLNRTVVVLSIK
jgi:hypothetical protein